MRRIGFLIFGIFAYGGAVAAELPEVTEAAVAELGSLSGVPQMTGFVFIEGRYVPPPYTVSRKGNGLFINRILVEQPVAWGLAGPAADSGQKKSVDADSDLEKEETPVEAPNPVAPGSTTTVKSIDDLFSDEEVSPALVTAAASGAEGTPEGTLPQQGRARAADKGIEKKKEAFLTSLERTRKGYELSLAQGEVFFFSRWSNRVNGNYGTARTLMGVLPKALRYAQSPQDLMMRLKQGGVYFLDLGMCSELFMNKNTFPLLEERLAKIEEAESFEAMRNKPVPRW